MLAPENASYPQGGFGGNTWSDVDFIHYGHLAGIKVSWGLEAGRQVLTSIQAQYGETWAPMHGTLNQCTSAVVYFHPEDPLSEINGESGQHVNFIRFITTKNVTSAGYGTNGLGSPFFWHRRGLIISYLSGRSGAAVDQLQAHYVSFVPKPAPVVSNSQGGTSGDKSWSDADLVSDTDRSDIRAIKVWKGLVYKSIIIRGIQFKYGDIWGPVHGITTKEEDSWYLEEDEYIQAIDGSSGAKIDSLTFITNKNQSKTFGGSSGSAFSRWTGGRALYFSGTEKTNDFLVQLQCHWIQ